MSIMDKICLWIEKNKRKVLKKKIIGSVVILLLFSVFAAVGYFRSKPVQNVKTEDVFKEEKNTEGLGKSNAVKNMSGKITVYINGEVNKPGVYTLKSDSRIQELVRVSGGFKSDADTLKVNLAEKLKDEDYIYIEKIQNSNNTAGQSDSSSSSSSKDDKKININKASKEELENIPGVGEVTAQKIIDYRESEGGFSSVEDIKNVDRIGDKSFEKMKDKIDIR